MTDHDLIARLRELARDLWWTWNPRATDLFRGLDPALWEACGHAPLALLERLGPEREHVLANDDDLETRLAAVESERRAYYATGTWFDRTHGQAREGVQIAYLCMEYGLHESLPLYAGGLGVLAGDHLKSASDLGIPMVAVGILWHEGYHRQEIGPEGLVRVTYPRLDPSTAPLTDTGERIVVAVGGEQVTARIWLLRVGRTLLYLLDTDLPGNSPRGRALSHRLYGGDQTHRIRQEVLLGVGGTHLLHHLGYRPTVWHLNEGHAAFAGLERLRRLQRGDRDHDEALAQVRASSVFTTHTPVPQGNDRFPPDLVRAHVGHYADSLGIGTGGLLGLGREDPDDPDEPFCMTVLALRLSAGANGVARLHGETARRMWVRVYEDAEEPAEVPIGHVTNGVHPATWTAPLARPLNRRHLGAAPPADEPEPDWWRRIGEVPAERLWALRQCLRAELVTRVRSRLADQRIAAGATGDDLADLYDTFDDDVLTIGFARRVASYKRAPLIFRDLARLETIVAGERPVQILFAGKPHPEDEGGRETVAFLHRQTRRPALRGRVHVLENYDLELGRWLTAGCDVWLNTPIRPMEASGTSGMKSCLNAGLNCSILDGWWAEAYDGTNGWSLEGRQGLPREEQDAADAATLYDILEHEVVPTFYDRDERGVPQAWVEMVRASMRSTFPRFSSHRMVRDYLQRYYLPAHDAPERAGAVL